MPDEDLPTLILDRLDIETLAIEAWEATIDRGSLDLLLPGPNLQQKIVPTVEELDVDRPEIGGLQRRGNAGGNLAQAKILIMPDRHAFDGICPADEDDADPKQRDEQPQQKALLDRHASNQSAGSSDRK